MASDDRPIPVDIACKPGSGDPAERLKQSGPRLSGWGPCGASSAARAFELRLIEFRLVEFRFVEFRAVELLAFERLDFTGSALANFGLFERRPSKPRSSFLKGACPLGGAQSLRCAWRKGAILAARGMLTRRMLTRRMFRHAGACSLGARSRVRRSAFERPVLVERRGPGLIVTSWSPDFSTAAMKRSAASAAISNFVSAIEDLDEADLALGEWPRRQMSGMSHFGSALFSRPTLEVEPDHRTFAAARRAGHHGPCRRRGACARSGRRCVQSGPRHDRGGCRRSRHGRCRTCLQVRAGASGRSG